MTRVVAVTGACGFIGRHVVERLLARGDYVYAVDALTYAADPSLPEHWTRVYGEERFHFVCRDIVTLGAFPEMIDGIVHLAAETHVDNSIADSAAFIHTNVAGTHRLLEMAARQRPRFVYVSTDEVYGDIATGTVTEDAPFRPSSPYAASKAAADLLVQAWGRTHGVPWNIVRPSNCYGLHQYPEKLIPKTIRWSVLGRPMLVHGDGTPTRSWLHVDDCAAAIIHVLDAAPWDGAYNVSGNTEASVTQVIEAVWQALRLARLGGTYATQPGTRPGVDLRYAVDDRALRALGWQPAGNLWRDIPAIVEAELARFRW